MSTDHDLESHPCHASYMAGKRYAAEHPGHGMSDAKRAARHQEDAEAFLDGFAEACEDEAFANAERGEADRDAWER